MAAKPDRLLDRIVPGLLLALALAGAYQAQRPTVVIASIALTALLLTRYWSRHSLRRVECERQLTHDRAFPGDELGLSFRLRNRKLLPLPWVEVEEHVSWPSTAIEVVEPTDAPSAANRLRMAGSLAWHEQLTWHYRLACKKRGIYKIGPASVTSGDPFGLFPRTTHLPDAARLVIYPRLIPVDQVSLPPGFPLGEAKAERWIFEDPSRTVGVREYRPEDSPRHIHWKASSRRRELQVRVHEPSTTVQIAIFLAVDAFADPTEPFEHAVSLAGSLANLLLEKRLAVGLYVNGGVPGGASSLEVPPGSSGDQLSAILEALAAVEPVACLAASRYLPDTISRLPWGCSVLVLAEKLPEDTMQVVEQMRESGRRLALLEVGRAEDTRFAVPMNCAVGVR